jgi:hypothetical protein
LLYLGADLDLGRDFFEASSASHTLSLGNLLSERQWNRISEFGNHHTVEEKLSQSPAQWEASLWLLCPSCDFWPPLSASGFESWSLLNIRALRKKNFFFFATNKTMFRANTHALKNSIVLWSPVNRSTFL